MALSRWGGTGRSAMPTMNVSFLFPLLDLACLVLYIMTIFPSFSLVFFIADPLLRETTMYYLFSLGFVTFPVDAPFLFRQSPFLCVDRSFLVFASGYVNYFVYCFRIGWFD